MAGLVSRVTLLMAVIAWCYGAIDISKYLQVCDRNSVDLNDCMAEAVQKGIESMAGGIEDIGVPGVDPYHQKELKVQYNNNQISAKMNLKDIYVMGLRGATVRDARVKADDDRLHVEIDLVAPQIKINGTYKGEGQYNALKLEAFGDFTTTMKKTMKFFIDKKDYKSNLIINGTCKGEGQYNALKLEAFGDFTTTMTGLVWTWKIDGTPEKIGSDVFMRIHSFEMRPDVDNMVSHLENYNPDSKALTDLGNDFLKSNWRVLYRELLPYAQANWNRSGIRIANKIFLKIPYIELFPISS